MESGGGWVVAENDVEALLEAVLQAGDPAERIRRGGAALAFARRHFDISATCGRIAEILEGSAN